MKKNIVMLIAIIVVVSFVACSNQNETYVADGNYISEPQLEQEVINLDYISVTNANNSLEPQRLRQGEEFLGLILESFEVQEIAFDPAGILIETVIANFSGAIEVSGELQFWEAIPDAVFIVHEEYYDLFPQLVQAFPRDGDFRFFIQNQTALLNMLGIGSLHELSYYGYSKEMTIRISNFTIMHDDTGVWTDRAHVLAVISDAPEVQDEVIEGAILPHPFATALAEYMDDYDAIVHAFLVTLDDSGAIGILTTRPATGILFDYDSGEYRYNPSGVLFYMRNGELAQIDVSDRWLFAAGRYHRLMERLETHIHVVDIIYTLEDGRLEEVMRLEYLSEEYLLMLFDDEDIVAEMIAAHEEQVEHAKERFGLDMLPHEHLQNTEDQTAQILALTINCVPSLAH